MAEAMRAKKVAICLYMVAIEGEKLTGCWFGPVESEKAEGMQESENTHAKTRRYIARSRENLQVVSISYRGNSGFSTAKEHLACNLRSRDSGHLDRYFEGIRWYYM